jgi:hypothetical protein
MPSECTSSQRVRAAGIQQWTIQAGAPGWMHTERNLRPLNHRPQTYGRVPSIKLTTAEYARRVAITGAILGLALVCWQVLDVLVLIFAGCILAIVLTSLARLVERFTPLKGPWALTASTLGLPVLFAGLGALLGWRLTDEVSEG